MDFFDFFIRNFQFDDIDWIRNKALIMQLLDHPTGIQELFYGRVHHAVYTSEYFPFSDRQVAFWEFVLYHLKYFEEYEEIYSDIVSSVISQLKHEISEGADSNLSSVISPKRSESFVVILSVFLDVRAIPVLFQVLDKIHYPSNGEYSLENDFYSDLRHLALDVLGKLGRPSFLALVYALDDPYSVIVYKAFDLLDDIDSPEFINYLYLVKFGCFKVDNEDLYEGWEPHIDTLIRNSKYDFDLVFIIDSYYSYGFDQSDKSHLLFLLFIFHNFDKLIAYIERLIEEKQFFDDFLYQNLIQEYEKLQKNFHEPQDTIFYTDISEEDKLKYKFYILLDELLFNLSQIKMPS